MSEVQPRQQQRDGGPGGDPPGGQHSQLADLAKDGTDCKQETEQREEPAVPCEAYGDAEDNQRGRPAEDGRSEATEDGGGTDCYQERRSATDLPDPLVAGLHVLAQASRSSLNLLGRENFIVEVLSPFPEDGTVDDFNIVDSLPVTRGRPPEDEERPHLYSELDVSSHQEEMEPLRLLLHLLHGAKKPAVRLGGVPLAIRSLGLDGVGTTGADESVVDVSPLERYVFNEVPAPTTELAETVGSEVHSSPFAPSK